jgi:hypothetical protein
MIFLLGFLTAGLLALAVAPAFWRRAERLSRRRLEMLMPVSPREVVAERDALRADFAMEVRRFEQTIEERGANLAAVQADLGRARAESFDGQTRLDALTAKHEEQRESLRKATRDQAEAEAGQFASVKALYDADALAADRAERLAAREKALKSLESLSDTQRASLSDTEARLAALSAKLSEAHTRTAAQSDELAIAHQAEARLRRDLQDKTDEIARLMAARDAADRHHQAQNEIAASNLALRLRADAAAHALTDTRSELQDLRATGAALNDIADLDDPRLRKAIHEIGATIARLSAADESKVA